MAESPTPLDERTPPIEGWIERLWARLEREAADHRGDVVIRLLREASNEIWDAGLDADFAELEADSLSDKAPAFDITWMTIFLLKIAKETPWKEREKQLRKEWRKAR